MYKVNFIFMAHDDKSIREHRAAKFFGGKNPLKMIPGWITQSYKTCENPSPNELYEINKQQIDFYKSIYNALYDSEIVDYFTSRYDKDVLTDNKATCTMYLNLDDKIVEQIEDFLDIQMDLTTKRDFNNVLLQPAGYIFNTDNKQKYIQNNSVVYKTDDATMTLAYAVLYYLSHIDIYLFMPPTALLTITPDKQKAIENKVDTDHKDMLRIVDNDSITINSEEKEKEENDMYTINIIPMDKEMAGERKTLANRYLDYLDSTNTPHDIFNGWSCDTCKVFTKDNLYAVMTSIIYKSIDSIYNIFHRQDIIVDSINNVYSLLFTGMDEMTSIRSLYNDKIDIFGDDFITSEYIEYNEVKNGEDILIFTVLLYNNHADILLFISPTKFFNSPYYVQPLEAMQYLVKDKVKVDSTISNTNKDNFDRACKVLDECYRSNHNNITSNINKDNFDLANDLIKNSTSQSNKASKGQGLSGVRLTNDHTESKGKTVSCSAPIINTISSPMPSSSTMTPPVLPTISVPSIPIYDGGISDIYGKTIFQIYDEIGYKSNKALMPLDNTTVAVLSYREIYTTGDIFNDENSTHYNINNPDARMIFILHGIILPVLYKQHVFRDTNSITVKELVDKFYSYYKTIENPSLKDITIDHILEVLDKIEMYNVIYKNGKFFRYDTILVNGSPYFKLDPEPITDPMLYRIQFAGGQHVIYSVKDIYNEVPDTTYWITDMLEENE